jgi:hypothetical protein
LAEDSQSGGSYSGQAPNSASSFMDDEPFGQMFCNKALGTSMLNIYSPCN